MSTPRVPGLHPLSTRQDGQTLVEFALVLPVFLLVVFGLLDVGRLVYINSSLSQAAREGARLGAAEASWTGRASPACVGDADEIGPSRPGAHVCPADADELKAHVVDAVNRMTVGLGPVAAVHLSCNADGSEPTGDWTEASGGNGCQDGPGGVSGDVVSVRVDYTFQPITPVISSLISTVPLSGVATMVAH